MAGRWRVVPHTADLALVVTGDGLEELLQAAALGLWSLGWDRRRVRPRGAWEVEAGGRDREALLVNFLNELIFRHETDRVVWRELDRPEVGEGPEGGLRARATARGEPLCPRHRLRREIKAATLHGLRLRRRGGRLVARIVFDL